MLAWYPAVDMFITKYYEVIVNLAKEIDMEKVFNLETKYQLLNLIS